MRRAKRRNKQITSSKHASQNMSSGNNQGRGSLISIPHSLTAPLVMSVSTTYTTEIRPIAYISRAQLLLTLHGTYFRYPNKTNPTPSLHQAAVIVLNSVLSPFLVNNLIFQKVLFPSPPPLQHHFQTIQQQYPH